ncbi:MAG: thiolase family protein [Actinobacteria bacterium]|nr:thiolase family protein [Actinomycetota bacterium]
MSSSFPRVAIAGIGVTEQRKSLGTSTLEACLSATKMALADAGMSVHDVDGVMARWPGPGGTVLKPGSVDWAEMLGIPVRWVSDTYPQGIPAVLEAAAVIGAGLCNTVLIVGGQAGEFSGNDVAPYTRPENEFVAPWGAFTAAHFAMIAERYLHLYQVDWSRFATVAATIRNYGHLNPDALMYGRGPYSASDILDSPMVASPFRRLDLCLANEGAAAMIVTSVERALDSPAPVVEVLGGGCEWFRQQYVGPARYEEVGMIGEDASRRAFSQAGLIPSDIDVAQLYDVNTFEVVRQFEALGFCGQGEGIDFVTSAGLGLDGRIPTNTDGGLMSFSHIGWGAPSLRVVEAVRQLRHAGADRQVPGAETAIAAGAGAGAQYYNVVLLGRSRANQAQS